MNHQSKTVHCKCIPIKYWGEEKEQKEEEEEEEEVEEDIHDDEDDNIYVCCSATFAARVVPAGRGLLLADGQQRACPGAARVAPGEGGGVPVALRAADQRGAEREGIPRPGLGPRGGRALPRLPPLLRLGQRSVHFFFVGGVVLLAQEGICIWPFPIARL